jgi:hypothetical protein
VASPIRYGTSKHFRFVFDFSKSDVIGTANLSAVHRGCEHGRRQGGLSQSVSQRE